LKCLTGYRNHYMN